MNNRFVGFRLTFLPLSLLALLLLPPSLEAQQQSDPTPAENRSSARDSSKSSSAEQTTASEQSDIALLTREYARVSKEAPKLVEKAVLPNAPFLREWYRAEWRVQDPFYFYVIRPKGVTKPPVILHLLSFPDDTDLFTNNKWCELAVRGGYATVGFVGAVTGHRTRYRLLNEWFVSEMPEALTSTTHDVQLLLDYLSSRGDLDMDHVAMHGEGSGASIAILASVVDARIKVLDLLAPWGDWKTWLNESKVVPDGERAAYLKPEFLAKVEPLDPILWLRRIHANSLRIIDVRGNKAMPDKAQEKLEAAAPDFALIDQYGNGRAFMAVQTPLSVEDWAKSQLAADAKRRVAMGKTDRIHFFPAIQPPPFPVEGLLPATTPAKAPAQTMNRVNQKENPK